MSKSLRHPEWVAILGALSAFAPMSIDMYLPALPTLERSFGATGVQTQATLATFFIGFALGQTFYGPVSDRFGRKAPLYAGVVIYILASIGCALAPSIHVLSFCRFFQAAGGCAGVVISRAMVRDLFEPQQAVRVYSSLMLVMGAAPILAPLFGGHLLVWFGWQAIFWTLAAFGILCLALVIFRLPETHHDRTHHSLALGSVLSGYAAFLSHRRFLGYALAGGCSTAGMFAYVAGSPFVFIDLYHIAPQHFGWLFGSNACGLIIASQINGRFLNRRFGPDRVLATANLVQAAAGLTLLVLAVTGFGGLAGIIVPLFVYVTCVGFISPNTTALAMAPFTDNAGAASAMLGTLQFTLGALSAIAVGAFHNTTALPMAAVIATCGMLGVVLHGWFVRFRLPAHY